MDFPHDMTDLTLRRTVLQLRQEGYVLEGRSEMELRRAAVAALLDKGRRQGEAQRAAEAPKGGA